jgi:hypothetical protein
MTYHHLDQSEPQGTGLDGVDHAGLRPGDFRHSAIAAVPAILASNPTQRHSPLSKRLEHRQGCD